MKIQKILIMITLIILIMLFLAGIILPQFIGPIIFTKHDAARPIMIPIESAIEAYNINTSSMPTKLEDLVNCPGGLENVWHGPYLKQSQLYDPWGNPYVYEPNTAALHGYNLISYGADGKPGGEGYDADVYND